MLPLDINGELVGNLGHCRVLRLKSGGCTLMRQRWRLGFMLNDMSIQIEVVVFECWFGQMSNAPLISERIVNNVQNRSE